MRGTQYYISGVLLRHVESTAIEFDIDVHRLCAHANIPPGVLKKSEGSISHQEYAKLLEYGATLSENSLFGLFVGDKYTVAKTGIIGALLSRQIDFASCYPVLKYALEVEKLGNQHNLYTQKNKAFHCIKYEFSGDYQQMIYADLIGTHCVFKELLGKTWQPICLHLTSQKKNKPWYLEQYLGCRVKYGSAINGYEFDARLLNSSVINTSINTPVQKKNMTQAIQLFDDLPRLIRYFIEHFLPFNLFEKTDIARMLGVHPRILQNSLKTHQTTYAQILTEVRMEQACKLLSETQLPIEDISLELGYSCAAAFVPRFKKWCGETPLQWRNKKQKFSF